VPEGSGRESTVRTGKHCCSGCDPSSSSSIESLVAKGGEEEEKKTRYGRAALWWSQLCGKMETMSVRGMDSNLKAWPL